jgi:hypothetical protein
MSRALVPKGIFGFIGADLENKNFIYVLGRGAISSSSQHSIKYVTNLDAVPCQFEQIFVLLQYHCFCR